MAEIRDRNGIAAPANVRAARRDPENAGCMQRQACDGPGGPQAAPRTRHGQRCHTNVNWCDKEQLISRVQVDNTWADGGQAAVQSEQLLL